MTTTTTKTIVPPIKCQGIKTKLVPWIRASMPDMESGRWIEPFAGSGVVAFNVRPHQALLADSNPHIINFYKAIASEEITPSITREFLESEGSKLFLTQGEYYYTVRDRFNQNGAPLDFLFLNRSCFNGLIRFNKRGDFNVPFCRKPNRFSKSYITKIVNQVRVVSDICRKGDYDFLHQDYSETIYSATEKDFIYCDPPYIARHTEFYNGWNTYDEESLANLLFETKSKFILSTWHSNSFRTNPFIESLWKDFHIFTREHFYHVGAKETNRNPMLEALVMNFVDNDLCLEPELSGQSKSF